MKPSNSIVIAITEIKSQIDHTKSLKEKLKCWLGFHKFTPSEVWVDIVRCNVCKKTRFTWETC